jgi:hypothetical protein
LNRKPFTEKYGQDFGANGIELSDGLSVILPINFRHKRVDASAGHPERFGSDPSCARW